MLTPFKLLPFFPVRVRLGEVLVNRDLVETLVRVRVVREHVGRSHLPIDRREGWSGTEGIGFQCVGKFIRTDQCEWYFPFRKTMMGVIG